ncbi:MAG: two-component system response regulator, partial [Gammaproteobacteria bacterium]|nr:two-component system response regulator [Gammaproteobacteria bacterium]
MNQVTADRGWLIIDDDEVFAQTLANALTRRGYRTDVAHNARDA